MTLQLTITMIVQFQSKEMRYGTKYQIVTAYVDLKSRT